VAKSHFYSSRCRTTNHGKPLESTSQEEKGGKKAVESCGGCRRAVLLLWDNATHLGRDQGVHGRALRDGRTSELKGPQHRELSLPWGSAVHCCALWLEGFISSETNRP